jgi:rod shape determining protein RodA
MTFVERRLTVHIDWPLICAVFALALVGLATIYSVTWDIPRARPGPQFWAQVYALPVALVAMFVCMMIDYRTLASRSIFLYAALVIGLVLVLTMGVKRGGAQRWIALGGGITLQPSEFARLTLALVLAGFFGAAHRSAKRWTGLFSGAVLLALPAFLIYKQPDLGTAVTLIPVFLGVVYLAGIQLRWLIVAAIVGALLSPVVWMYGLKDYQKDRIETFLDPSKDPRGEGYQQIQARITVGSGGLSGKGFRGGTQGSYGFLPVAHNDFVYSVLAEERGFLGVLATLGLYLFVIVRSLDAAELAKDRTGAFLVVAIISGFGFQVLYNITMSAGLAPVKGLTLPLMSYGGSSLVATMAGFGLILNVKMRRFTN